jgi:putative transposase
MRKAYDTDASDEQWAILEPLIPPAKKGGRPRSEKTDMREIVNAIFYVNRSGCQWRLLPHDFPPKSTVYYYFSQWRDDGTWDVFTQSLREQVRVAAGKEPTPSMAIVDSQSVKGTETSGPHGIDANKKINGRKRHLLTDTLGLILAVVVTNANILDGYAAQALFAQMNQRDQPRLRKILGDQAYGKCGLPAWVQEHGYYVLEITCKDPDQKGFKVIKWRWVVERTHAWMGRYRRHSRDYERRTESSEAMIKASSLQLMLQRLRPKPNQPRFKYRKNTAKTL